LSKVVALATLGLGLANASVVLDQAQEEASLEVSGDVTSNWLTDGSIIKHTSTDEFTLTLEAKGSSAKYANGGFKPRCTFQRYSGENDLNTASQKINVNGQEYNLFDGLPQTIEMNHDTDASDNYQSVTVIDFSRSASDFGKLEVSMSCELLDTSDPTNPVYGPIDSAAGQLQGVVLSETYNLVVNDAEPPAAETEEWEKGVLTTSNKEIDNCGLETSKSSTITTNIAMDVTDKRYHVAHLDYVTSVSVPSASFNLNAAFKPAFAQTPWGQANIGPQTLTSTSEAISKGSHVSLVNNRLVYTYTSASTFELGVGAALENYYAGGDNCANGNLCQGSLSADIGSSVGYKSTNGIDTWCSPLSGLFEGLNSSAISGKRPAGVYPETGTLNVDAVFNVGYSEDGSGDVSSYEIPFNAPTATGGYSEISGCTDIEGMHLQNYTSNALFKAAFEAELAKCDFGVPPASFYDNNFQLVLEGKESNDIRFNPKRADWQIETTDSTTADSNVEISYASDPTPPEGKVSFTACSATLDAGDSVATDAFKTLVDELDSCSFDSHLLELGDDDLVYDNDSFLAKTGAVNVQCNTQTIEASVAFSLGANDGLTDSGVARASHTRPQTAGHPWAAAQGAVHPASGATQTLNNTVGNLDLADEKVDITVNIGGVDRVKEVDFECTTGCHENKPAYNCHLDTIDIPETKWTYTHPGICTSDDQDFVLTQKVYIELADDTVVSSFVTQNGNMELAEKDLYDLSKENGAGAPLSFSMTGEVFSVVGSSVTIKWNNAGETGYPNSKTCDVSGGQISNCEIHYVDAGQSNILDGDGPRNVDVEYQLYATYAKSPCSAAANIERQLGGDLTATTSLQESPDSYAGVITFTDFTPGHPPDSQGNPISIGSDNPVDSQGNPITHPDEETVLPVGGFNPPEVGQQATNMIIGVVFGYDTVNNAGAGNASYRLKWNIDEDGSVDVAKCSGVVSADVNHGCKDMDTTKTQKDITIHESNLVTDTEFFLVTRPNACGQAGHNSGDNAFADDQKIDFEVISGAGTAKEVSRIFRVRLNCKQTPFTIQIKNGDNWVTLQEVPAVNDVITSYQDFSARSSFYNQVFKLRQDCETCANHQLTVASAQTKPVSDLTIPLDKSEVELSFDTKESCTNLASIALTTEGKIFNVRSKCIRFANEASDAVLEHELHLSYDYEAVFALGTDNNGIIFSDNPQYNKDNGIDMDTQIGGSCDSDNVMSGEICATTVFSGQDLSTSEFLTKAGVCGNIEEVEGDNQFIRSFDIVRQFTDGANNYCNSRKVRVSLVRDGSVSATVQVQSAADVNFLVNIDDLEFAECDHTGTNDGYQVKLTLSADVKENDGNYTTHEISSTSVKRLTSEVGSHQLDEVNDKIIALGTCRAKTSDCGDFAADNAIKNTDFELWYSSDGGEYAAIVNIDTELDGCPVEETEDVAHSDGTLVVEVDGAILVKDGDDFVVQSDDVVSVALSTANSAMNSELTKVTIDGVDYCDGLDAEYGALDCNGDAAPANPFTFNAAPAQGSTITVLVEYSYTLGGARLRRLLRAELVHGEEGATLKVLPASMELNDKMEGSADEAVSTDSDVNVWMIVALSVIGLSAMTVLAARCTQHGVVSNFVRGQSKGYSPVGTQEYRRAGRFSSSIAF